MNGFRCWSLATKGTRREEEGGELSSFQPSPLSSFLPPFSSIPSLSRSRCLLAPLEVLVLHTSRNSSSRTTTRRIHLQLNRPRRRTRKLNSTKIDPQHPPLQDEGDLREHLLSRRRLLLLHHRRRRRMLLSVDEVDLPRILLLLDLLRRRRSSSIRTRIWRILPHQKKATTIQGVRLDRTMLLLLLRRRRMEMLPRRRTRSQSTEEGVELVRRRDLATTTTPTKTSPTSSSLTKTTKATQTVDHPLVGIEQEASPRSWEDPTATRRSNAQRPLLVSLANESTTPPRSQNHLSPTSTSPPPLSLPSPLRS